MGGLGRTMPITASGFAVGMLGLVGLLPLGGFWAMQRGVDRFWLDAPWIVGVLLLVNGLTAFNLTRVFRLVFLGPAQVKTCRAPEVGWQMALPMIGLSVTTISVPFMLRQLTLLPPILSLNPAAETLMIASGFLGCAVGCGVELKRAWLSPGLKFAGWFHNLLAYDFHIEHIYRLSVVFAVTQLSRWTAWCDRYILDSVVNSVGITTLFGGQSLKYLTSGASQSYVLTILLGVGVLVLIVGWELLQGVNLFTVISFLF
jgi:NAD(P)H-quinone oxidoreductase subunit 5